MAVLRYGNNSSFEIELAAGRPASEVGVPRAQPLADAAAATAAALAEPADYPPLARSTTPADRIVLALDRGLPQAAEVVAAIVQTLVNAGVDPDGIAVLRSPSDRDAGAEDPRRLLAAALQERVTLATHDPADRRQLAYLAASESGEAILLNRALHEADLVLPVGCLHGDQAAGYFGIHNAVYPTFSDAKTLERFRGLGSLNGRGARKRELVAEADNVAWLLGVNFTVQLVPAGGEQVLDVLAGQSEAVRRRGRELYTAAWDWPVSSRADLVVAAVDGGAAQQTWENVGRAIEVAGRFAEEGGAIAVCCNLAGRPGPAVQRLAHTASRPSALRQIDRHRPVDALPAAQLASALERNKVYLLSQLDPSLIEDLEMIPLEGPEELARLARRHSSCVLVSNAPYVTATKEHHGMAPVANDA